MGYQGDSVTDFKGNLFYVGLSGTIGITVLPAQNAVVFKHGGGGTLWIGGPTLSPGAGYLMSLGEALCMNSRGTVYFYSSGATCTVYSFIGANN